MDIKVMLRALVKEGYTLEAIASGAKVHPSTICRILSGKIKEPKYFLCVKISEIFNGTRLGNHQAKSAGNFDNGAYTSSRNNRAA